MNEIHSFLWRVAWELLTGRSPGTTRPPPSPERQSHVAPMVLRTIASRRSKKTIIFSRKSRERPLSACPADQSFGDLTFSSNKLQVSAAQMPQAQIIQRLPLKKLIEEKFITLYPRLCRDEIWGRPHQNSSGGERKAPYLVGYLQEGRLSSWPQAGESLLLCRVEECPSNSCPPEPEWRLCGLISYGFLGEIPRL